MKKKFVFFCVARMLTCEGERGVNWALFVPANNNLQNASDRARF